MGYEMLLHYAYPGFLVHPFLHGLLKFILSPQVGVLFCSSIIFHVEMLAISFHTQHITEEGDCCLFLELKLNMLTSTPEASTQTLDIQEMFQAMGVKKNQWFI